MSEELITDICKQRKFQLPEDMRDEEDEDEEDFEEEIEEDESEEYIEEEPAEEFVVPQRKTRGGFFAILFAGIAGASEGINEAQNHHNGRCNGDCAHCPPHYGRWI